MLRHGGRLALATWGAAERNPFFGLLAMRLVERGHLEPPEPPPAPGPFSLPDGEHVEALLRGAGFAEVRTEEVPVRFAVPSVGEYLSLTADTAGPIALALQGLEAAERAGIEEDIEEALEPFASRSGYELPGVALCAMGCEGGA